MTLKKDEKAALAIGLVALAWAWLQRKEGAAPPAQQPGGGQFGGGGASGNW